MAHLAPPKERLRHDGALFMTTQEHGFAGPHRRARSKTLAAPMPLLAASSLDEYDVPVGWASPSASQAYLSQPRSI